MTEYAKTICVSLDPIAYLRSWFAYPTATHYMATDRDFKPGTRLFLPKLIDNTKLIIQGHCNAGSDILVSNFGVKRTVEDINNLILNMCGNHSPKNLKIKLTACSAITGHHLENINVLKSNPSEVVENSFVKKLQTLLLLNEHSYAPKDGLTMSAKVTDVVTNMFSSHERSYVPGLYDEESLKYFSLAMNASQESRNLKKHIGSFELSNRWRSLLDFEEKLYIQPKAPYSKLLLHSDGSIDMPYATGEHALSYKILKQLINKELHAERNSWPVLQHKSRQLAKMI